MLVGKTIKVKTRDGEITKEIKSIKLIRGIEYYLFCEKESGKVGYAVKEIYDKIFGSGEFIPINNIKCKGLPFKSIQKMPPREKKR